MKKLALAVAAAAALTTGVSHAYTMGTFSNGFVVPNVIHDGANISTAVGVVSAQAAAVHWTFFDQDSVHVTDDCFAMTANDYHGVVWKNVAGTLTAGKRGYLVFAVAASTAGGDAATTCAPANKALAGTGVRAIAGHAFEYDLTAKDVAYIPVIDGPLVTDGTAIDLMGPSSLLNVDGAADVGATLYMRYYIDGAAGGDDTRIAVWSTGNHAGTKTVNIYDDKQTPKSVNFILTKKELDFLDPETIVGRPESFKDGFVVWNTGVAGNGIANDATGSWTSVTGSVFSYSVISAPAFGAVQTILNPAR